MKILSIAIPCYNSQEYMRKCIESLLPGGEDVEIIVVNDGSKDNTAAIADEYAEKYPTIVKAVHQENGGHGEAVNAGLRNATGLYFKVVDSDDWVDADAYPKILAKLKELVGGPDTIDMMISNYVYDKVGVKRKKIMQYRRYLPTEEAFEWKDIKKIRVGHYILMHSVIYRTELLRECGLQLPKHTFYVDNLFVFQPLPRVKKMYYMDVEFYHYYIGREDQSVNEQVMIGRIDQQIKVNKLMIDTMAELKGQRIVNKMCRKYMLSYLDIIMTVSSMLLIKSGTDENFEKKQELWKYLRSADGALYRKIRHGLLGRACNLPGKGGRTVSVAAYKVTQKFYGFN
ncbi:MAG: glycosyltransferase family 2 protein [Eubacteriales bacterium]|nr:glycosyltransferase family 2 protein [Eubacteriales bacterium]